MSVLSLTAWTLFLCFVTSCEAAEKSISELIKEAAKALEKDWKSESDVIIHLLDQVNKLDKSLAACQIRQKDFEKQLLGFTDSQKTVKKDIADLDSKLNECCDKLSKDPHHGQHIFIDWDDKGQLWLNGQEIKELRHSAELFILDAILLPTDTKVIALKGTNNDGDAGILASTLDGFILTNASWKCSKKEEKGWTGTDFNDSKWPKAHVVTSAKIKPVVGIREDASWIWTENYKPGKGDKDVFCRLKLK